MKDIHVRITDAQEAILEQLIADQNLSGLSQAIRSCIDAAAEPPAASADAGLRKDVEIIKEMVAVGFTRVFENQRDTSPVFTSAKETYIHMDAKQNVERKIQRDVTVRSQKQRGGHR